MSTKNITNWYDKLPKKDSKDTIKRDSNYKNHMIEPCSMIVCVGGTGKGKTNSVIDFISKKQTFCDILIYSGSTTDEPLYKMLKEKIPETQLFSDIDEFPELQSFEEDKTNEKIIVFDDFINLNTKQMKKINEYLTAGRKFGFTIFCLAQNYRSIPKTVSRNAHYFFIYQLNDNATINNILKNHNIHDIPKEIFKELYKECTKDKLNFFMIDLKNESSHLRHNWLELLNFKALENV